LAIDQFGGSIDDNLLGGIDPRNQLDFTTDTFAGFHQSQMGAIIGHYENQFHLTTLNDGGDRHAKHRGGANRYCYAPKLPSPQPRLRGQIELHHECAAVRIGCRRDLADDSFKLLWQRLNSHAELGAHFHPANDRLGYSGFEPQRFRIFHLHQRFSGAGEIAHVSELARNHAVKRRGDCGVGEVRLSLGDCRLCHTRSGLDRIELLLRNRAFFDQH